ncbi:hypothetical protein VHEMI04122 [[Torrubiella] hemipterigena]|uniref:Uncharacterized protein n=1 Tax=[Torrubiella] hemipterigena TaxID=1531966 RepID=A0A0A1TDE1_9HYPO|nr:hypothetical protein VHEMI04122 [[Torrubiella] hemipterigena]
MKVFAIATAVLATCAIGAPVLSAPQRVSNDVDDTFGTGYYKRAENIGTTALRATTDEETGYYKRAGNDVDMGRNPNTYYK